MELRTFMTFVALAATTVSASAAEARVFILDSCPASSRITAKKETGAVAAALLAKVAGAIVGGAIDSLASALSDERAETFVATNRHIGWYSKGSGATYKFSSKIVCIVGVVSDGFDQFDEPEARKRMELEADRLKRDKSNQAALQTLVDHLPDLRAMLGVDRPPLFYFEAVFVIPESEAVFALEPTFLYYPKTLGSNVFLGGDKRDVLIQFDFSEPGESAAFASQQLQFTNVASGSLTTERVSKIKLPWMKPPGTPSASSEGTGLAVPFNMKFLFTETAKPGRLGKILGGVLKDQKATITSAVEDKAKLALSESDRQAARTSANDAANTALAAYFKAYDDYKAALDGAKAAAAGTPEKAKAEAKQKLALVVLNNAQSLAGSTMAAAGAAFTPLDLPT